jgi:hypothetical protein
MKSNHIPHEKSEIAIVRLRLYIVSFVRMSMYVMEPATRPTAKTVKPSRNPLNTPEVEGVINTAERRPAIMQTNAKAENTFRSDGSRNSDE